jgi:hypothetical protein
MLDMLLTARNVHAKSETSLHVHGFITLATPSVSIGLETESCHGTSDLQILGAI